MEYDWNVGLIIGTIGFSFVAFIILYGLFVLLLGFYGNKNKFVEHCYQTFAFSEKLTFNLFACTMITLFISGIFFMASRDVAISTKIRNNFRETFKNNDFYIGSAGTKEFASMNPKFSDDEKIMIYNGTKYFIDTIKNVDVDEFIKHSDENTLKILLNLKDKFKKENVNE